MRRRVRPFDFLGAQARKLSITLRVFWVGRGTPKTARAEHQRRCSYPRLERILRFLGR